MKQREVWRNYMNNRIYKFRAWIKEDKRMIFSPCVDSNDLADKTMPSFWSICEDNTTYKDDVILMQFTGLLDKNGKEIFEGDIVRVTLERWPNKEGFKQVGFVEYTPCSFVLRTKDERTYLSTSQPKIRNKNLEVIGNIYSNPELLEKQT